MSKFCAIKKAIPDPRAILIEIISSKFVEIINVNKNSDDETKIKQFSCYKLIKTLLQRSVIKKVIG